MRGGRRARGGGSSVLLARLLPCLVIVERKLQRTDCCCCCCLWCRCQSRRPIATAVALTMSRACSASPRTSRSAASRTTTRGAGNFCSIVRNIISNSVADSRQASPPREARRTVDTRDGGRNRNGGWMAKCEMEKKVTIKQYGERSWRRPQQCWCRKSRAER